MRIVIAPQEFKGTLSGGEAADAIAKGVSRVFPEAELVRVPVADGGQGTLDALVVATGGHCFTAKVVGPIGGHVEAQWGALGVGMGIEGEAAVVEMARASGLTLVPAAGRNPMAATTYGTGELIKAALDGGYRRVIVGVGGSATNDGGAGAAQALGVRLLDALGHDIPRGAEGLLTLERIDLGARDRRLAEVTLQVAVDVSNPLVGPNGAARTYGPQKGAKEEQVPILEEALEHFAAVIDRELRVDVRHRRGTGAAGGLAAGLLALCGAELVPGAPLVCNVLGLDKHLDGAALVVTGEGRIDWQTVFDKAPIEVAKRASSRGIAVIAIGGSLGHDAYVVLQHGVSLLEAAAPDGSVPSSLPEARQALAAAAERAMRRSVAHGTLAER